QVWLKGSVLKTERGVKACGGSNPSSSSIHITQLYKGSVAQSVEQRTENPCVGGSIPSRAIFLHLLKQAACLFFIFIYSYLIASFIFHLVTLYVNHDLIPEIREYCLYKLVEYTRSSSLTYSIDVKPNESEMCKKLLLSTAGDMRV